MSQKNVDKFDSRDETTPTSKLRAATTSKRQMSESPKHRSHAAKATPKRLKIDDAFTNPWRCESEPYNPLPIVYHKPIYNSPCYLDENLKHLTKRERAHKIMSYHYALSMQMSLYARAQPKHALLGDPIQRYQLFNGILDKPKQLPTSAGDCPSEQQGSPYISRSGRLVKRRQMNVFQILDEDDEAKEANVKKVKVTEEQPKILSAPRRVIKKTIPEESLPRSSLFADSPVMAKSTRTQAMFTKLEEVEKETKKAEAEKTKFEKTLLPQCNDDDEDDMEITSSQNSPKPEEIDDDNEDFVRRRIVPPVLNARKLRGAPTKKSDSSATSSPGTPSADDVRSVAKTVNGGASTSTNKRGPKKKITTCPICGISFPVKEIEEHASTCGLTNELEIESCIPNQRIDPAHF